MDLELIAIWNKIVNRKSLKTTEKGGKFPLTGEVYSNCMLMIHLRGVLYTYIAS